MPRCLCARATVARDHGTRTVLVVPAACSLAVDGDSTPMRVPPASQRDTHPHTPCTRPLAPPCAVWLARARGRLARRTASTRSGAVALAGPAWPLQGLGWCTRLNVVAAPGWRVCTEARRSFVRLRHRHPRHLRFGRHARTHVPVAQPPWTHRARPRLELELRRRLATGCTRPAFVGCACREVREQLSSQRGGQWLALCVRSARTPCASVQLQK